MTTLRAPVDKRFSERHSRAFTLVEVMIAMVIFALVSAMSFRALRDTTNMQSLLEKRTEEFSAEQIVWSVLFDDIANMARRPTQVGDSGKDIKQAFAPKLEDPDCLFSFTRAGIPPGISAAAGMQRVSYCLKSEALYRKVWPVLDPTFDTEPHEALLLEKVYTFDMEWEGVKELISSTDPVFDYEALPYWVKIEMETETGLYQRYFPGADPYDPFRRKK